jgi:hypothetical protein
MRACISPRLQVQIKGPTGLWQELGRTDVVQNNLNPEFKKKVELDYTFEKKQELKFIVYDWLTPPPRAPHSRPHSAAVCGTCGQVARACGMLALVRGARQRSMHKTSCLCRLPPHPPPPLARHRPQGRQEPEFGCPRLSWHLRNEHGRHRRWAGLNSHNRAHGHRGHGRQTVCLRMHGCLCSMALPASAGKSAGARTNALASACIDYSNEYSAV